MFGWSKGKELRGVVHHIDLVLAYSCIVSCGTQINVVCTCIDPIMVAI